MHINGNEIGLRIKQLRNEKGVTQQELAWKLQITIACLSRYERGHRIPRMDTIEKIAKIFDADLNYFLDHSNSNCNKNNNDAPDSKEKTIAEILMLLNNANETIVSDVKKYAELLLFKEQMEKKEV
jgi:transcriptional regulator with XRE-family HTH domain